MSAWKSRGASAPKFSGLLCQHHDRPWFDQVFRADDRDFTSGRKDVLRGFEARVHHTAPGFLQTIKDREAERLSVRVDHDVKVEVLL
jgi:hypothetical protein